MFSNLKNFITKFKKWIIYFLVGGTALASGLSGIPQDLYNNLNVKVYTVCNLQTAKRTSINDDLQNFKARNPDNSLRALDAREKASLKSCEIAKKGTEFAGIYDSAQYGTRIEIIGEVKNIEVNGQHGIELFARAWKNGKQLGFSKDGSVEIERFRIFNPPILVDDPNGTIIREGIDDITGQLKQRKLREDSLEAIKQTVAHNAKIVGIENAPIVIGKVGNTTSTYYPQAGSGGANVTTDGRIGYVTGATWAESHDAATGNAIGETDTSQNVANSSTPGIHIYRSGFGFDTSNIPDTDTIDSATFSIFDDSASDAGANADTTSLQLVQFSPAVVNDFATSDYTIGVEFLTTSFGSLALSAKIADAYNDIAINATGIATISKTSTTVFGIMTELDRSNTAPTGANRLSAFFADQTGTASDPKLVVVHSASATTRGEEYLLNFE